MLAGCLAHAAEIRLPLFLREGAAVEFLEEHLLICSECRDRLLTTDEYVAAMKAAAARIGVSGKGD